MSKYTHSEAFASLKNTNEKIGVNLTSYQYLTVLDSMLYEAITPIVTNTKFFDVFLSQMIGWQTLNPKRKTCAVGRIGLVTLSTLFFLTMDGKQKMKLVKRMKLHRNILFECISRWLDLIKEYPKLSTQMGTTDLVSRMAELHENGLVRTGYSLHATYTSSTYWYKKAHAFKEQIMEKFTRMVISTAQRDYKDMVEKGIIGDTEKLDDMVQSYMITMSKAVDKCDADRGVLTSYIQSWLKSARNNVEKRSSGDGSQIHRKIGMGQRIEYVELENVEDTVSDDEGREREDTIRRVRMLAKLFDPDGFGRLALGVQEQLTEDDRSVLHSLSVKRPEMSTTRNV